MDPATPYLVPSLLIYFKTCDKNVTMLAKKIDSEESIFTLQDRFLI
jgi:hypothetical protein